MRLLLMILAVTMAVTAEQHFYYKVPLYASGIQKLGLPSAHVAHDTLMVNVRLIAPNPFRLRVFLTVRPPSGFEQTYEREVRVKPDELWATVVFDEPQILDSEFVRIRFKEEPEPAALAESTVEVEE